MKEPNCKPRQDIIPCIKSAVSKAALAIQQWRFPCVGHTVATRAQKQT